MNGWIVAPNRKLKTTLGLQSELAKTEMNSIFVLAMVLITCCQNKMAFLFVGNTGAFREEK